MSSTERRQGVSQLDVQVLLVATSTGACASVLSGALILQSFALVVMASIIALLMFATFVLVMIRARKQLFPGADEDPGERLQRRIEAVDTAFAEAASLMDDLRRDLEAQHAARDALLEQADEQQQLIELNREQAEKIRKILVGETKATIRAERRREWLFFLLGFLASAAASVPIGIWVNHIS
jgi:hypothetical protein